MTMNDWEKIQALRKELRRWQVKKFIGSYYYERVEFDSELNFMREAESFIRQCIATIRALRKRLKPPPVLKLKERIKIVNEGLIWRAKQELPHIPYNMHFEFDGALKNALKPTNAWRELGEHNFLVCGNKIVTTAKFLEERKEVSIYEVEYITTVNLEVQKGYMGVKSKFNSIGSTPSGVVRGVNRRILTEVGKALT